MKDNLNLKRGLITQSLSPVFGLLIIRHVHFDFQILICKFFDNIFSSPKETIVKMWFHPRLGELLIVVCGLVWVINSFIISFAFNATRDAGFESRGEMVTTVQEQKDAAASFLMTFILPLLIDELSSPQYWFSYILVIIVVYAVLYQSNLYYQSPVLALLGYRVFKFKIKNPSDSLEKNTEYIGITKKSTLNEESAIMWKHIADDVFLIYNEGGRRY